MIKLDLNYRLLQKHAEDCRNAESNEEFNKCYKRMQDFVYKLSLDAGFTPKEAKKQVRLMAEGKKLDLVFTKKKKVLQ